jgi:hypothetical protein
MCDRQSNARTGVGGSFPGALRDAGSSLFTLGFAARSGTEPSAAGFLAAAGDGRKSRSIRFAGT